MKTSVTLISKDRDLFGTTIRQDTKTGMLSLSDLTEAYTQERVKNGWAIKNISEILNSSHNDETIHFLLEKQGIIKIDFSTFTKEIENQGFVKYLKSLGVYRTTGKGANREVWVNPYIFVMVAMELNPRFKGTVIAWLTDELIINRVEAGTMYIRLGAGIGKISTEERTYPYIAIKLNQKIFGRHETGIRNQGSKKELQELSRLEDQLATLIEDGYIKTVPELVAAIDRYRYKYLHQENSK